MSFRKGVVESTQSTFFLQDRQIIARVCRLLGGNLVEAELPHASASLHNDNKVLCRFPSKFHKLLWIKPGSFVVVQHETSSKPNARVSHEIANVVYSDQMKLLKQQKLWPAEFDNSFCEDQKDSCIISSPKCDHDDHEEDFIPPNPNHSKDSRKKEELSDDDET